MAQPPPIPLSPEKKWRMARTMNLLFPGAGLIYVGKRGLGIFLALSFCLCFLAVLMIFLVGYSRYLSAALSGDILQANRIEEISAGFHPRWLLAAMIAGVAVYGVSIVALIRERRNQRAVTLAAAAGDL